MLNFNSNNRLFQFVCASFLCVCVCVIILQTFQYDERKRLVSHALCSVFSLNSYCSWVPMSVLCVYLNWDWVVMFYAITAIVTRCHTIATAAQSAFPTKNRLQWFKLLVFDALLCNCTPQILITSLPFKTRAIFCITVREIVSAFQISILFFSFFANRICCQPHSHLTHWLSVFFCRVECEMISFSVGSFRCSCSAWYLGRSRIEWR